MNGKTLKVICENSVISTLMLESSDSQHDSMFIRNNQRNYNEDIEEDKNDAENNKFRNTKDTFYN